MWFNGCLAWRVLGVVAYSVCELGIGIGRDDAWDSYSFTTQPWGQLPSYV